MFSTDDARILSQVIADPAMPVDSAWALSMHERYPAFVLPIALLLSRNAQDLDDDQRLRLQSIVMLNSADSTAFAQLCDLHGDHWADFYPAPQPKEAKNTTDTITDFLDSYGKPTEAETALLERLIFNPVGEYVLQEEEDEKEAVTVAPAQPVEPAKPAEPAEATPPPFRGLKSAKQLGPKATENTKETSVSNDSSCMMESLARIFIKQQRYERAFVIINNLSLKYPEKSVYFADQLRFLQKLIINSKYKTK